MTKSTASPIDVLRIAIIIIAMGMAVTGYAAGWMDGLPTVPVTAKPLDKVWATVSEGGGPYEEHNIVINNNIIFVCGRSYERHM